MPTKRKSPQTGTGSSNMDLIRELQRQRKAPAKISQPARLEMVREVQAKVHQHSRETAAKHGSPQDERERNASYRLTLEARNALEDYRFSHRKEDGRPHTITSLLDEAVALFLETRRLEAVADAKGITIPTLVEELISGTKGATPKGRN